MELLEFADLPIIDCHVHFSSEDLNMFENAMKNESTNISEDYLYKLETFWLDVIKEGKISQIYLTGLNTVVYLKTKYPQLFYAGGFIPWSGMTDKMPNVNWREYIGSLIDVGFDGIGEFGSKPVHRNTHEPLDGDYYAALWESCETLEFPILCHVADPEEFWNEKLAPDWAKKFNWVYDNKNYQSKEELYKEIENVLDRHNDLKIIFCHFYFLSADLERASEFLNSYKCANFDLAPGIELLYNISRRRDDWREFFIKYQDRIFYGTDIIGNMMTLQHTLDVIWLVRTFLESDEEFYTPDTADLLLTKYKEPFLGLNLPTGVLKKIYAENFQRLWGKTPNSINLNATIKRCEEDEEKTLVNVLRNFL